MVPWSSKIDDFQRWPTCLKYGKYGIKLSFPRFLASWLPRHLLKLPWLNFGANLEHFGEALELFFVIFEVLFLKLFLETLLDGILAKMLPTPALELLCRSPRGGKKGGVNPFPLGIEGM